MQEFIELKTMENQTIYVRREAVGAFEVVHPSSHIEGHIKIFIGGYKFLVQADKEELIKKLSIQGK